jgi:hypothetical protein
VYALELTTGEVVDGLNGFGVPGDDVQAFMGFAGRCDLVKFAKLWPVPDACRDTLSAARAFVDQTRPGRADAEPVLVGAAQEVGATPEFGAMQEDGGA